MTTMASSSQVDIPELRLGHEIFISHSGQDKNFVRFLVRELKHHWYDPFFDEQSLPKAHEVSMQKILIEARSSKLALFVLTEAFFTKTRNPMMEAIACVESNVQLLPVFYMLDVEQVKKNRNRFREKWIELNAEQVKKNRNRFREKWIELNAEANDNCPDIDMWSNAFNKLTSFNGLEYGKKSTNEDDYIQEIVDNVYIILPPYKPRDDTHVVGKERLVKSVESMFDKSPDVQRGIKVLGLHGMEGMGKTTLCDALCNFYLTKFEGRVCHVKLHEGSQDDRIKSVMLDLGQRKDYSSMTYSQKSENLKSILKSSKFFLVLDDIQDSSQPDKDEIGKLLLNSIKDIPMGSKLLFLARSSSVLRNVLSRTLEWSVSAHIYPFPSLSLDEAMRQG